MLQSIVHASSTFLKLLECIVIQVVCSPKRRTVQFPLYHLIIVSKMFISRKKKNPSNLSEDVLYRAMKTLVLYNINSLSSAPVWLLASRRASECITLGFTHNTFIMKQIEQYTMLIYYTYILYKQILSVQNSRLRC